MMVFDPVASDYPPICIFHFNLGLVNLTIEVTSLYDFE